MATRSTSPTSPTNSSPPTHPCLLEAVDDRNRPLAVLTRDDVHRQGLCHRRCVMVAFSGNGRLCLRRRAMDEDSFPGRWDFPVSRHVPAGDSHEEVIENMLDRLRGLHVLVLQPVRTLPAASQSGQEFLTIFQAQAKLKKSLELAALDRIEAERLATDYPDQLTPLLVHLWRSGILPSLWMSEEI